MNTSLFALHRQVLVVEEGDKLPQDVAELLFPDFAEKYDWRV